jgi:hypothetical protein
MVAIVKYMVMVITSLIMVANGPEAIAGSKFIFLAPMKTVLLRNRLMLAR